MSLSLHDKHFTDRHLPLSLHFKRYFATLNVHAHFIRSLRISETLGFLFYYFQLKCYLPYICGIMVWGIDTDSRIIGKVFFTELQNKRKHEHTCLILPLFFLMLSLNEVTETTFHYFYFKFSPSLATEQITVSS